MMTSTRQFGASLVTVLMIVAAMSAVAVGVTQTLTQGVFRAKNLDRQAQMRVAMDAAEAYGKFELAKLLLESEGLLSSDMPGFFAPISREFEQGKITLSFVDKTNCFDLNRLGSGDGNNYIASSADEIEALINILALAGIDRYAAEIFAESAADFIDSDTLSLLRGAEDTYYESERLPVRSRGDWLLNSTEMYGIRGFNTEIRSLAADLLCVRPRNKDQSPESFFNINTIQNTQLPLLVAAYDGSIELSTLEDALRRRPTGGWASLDEFIEDSALAEIDPEFLAEGDITVFSQYIAANVQLQYQGLVVRYEVLYELGLDTPVRIVQRRRLG